MKAYQQRRGSLQHLARLSVILLYCCLTPTDAWIVESSTKSSRSSAAASTRRKWLSNAIIGVATSATGLKIQPAVARNLPESTGAESYQSGSIQSLIPIVAMRQQIALALSVNDNESFAKLRQSIPVIEKDFKRLLDAYSEPVSYKQRFMDQNAFLVYYTQGFDGPGRPSLEQTDSRSLQQIRQYGARNDAWIAWDEFVVECDYPESTLPEQQRLLKQVLSAFDEYLNLAPPEDLEAAQARLQVP